MSQVIAANLRRLRAAEDLTQAEVARRAGLSRAGYRKIESGEVAPRSDTLNALAESLEVGITDLVRQVAQLRRIRFRAQKTMKSREQIIARVARWLSDFNELEEILGESHEFKLRNQRSAEPAEAARRARQELELDHEHREEPIHDICGLLESAGVKVYPLKVATDSFFGLSVAPEDGGPAVIVNVWERISVERRIFTAAHELGHLVLHLDAYDVENTDEEDVQEEEADRFAAYFLMPETAFWNEWNDTYGRPFYDRVLKIKRIFGVSYATVLYRLRERYPDSASRLWERFLLEHAKRTGRLLRKEDEPNPLSGDAFREGRPEPSSGKEPDRLSPSDFGDDRLYLLVRRAIEAESITLSRGSEILGYPLGEMRHLAQTWSELGPLTAVS